MKARNTTRACALLRSLSGYGLICLGLWANEARALPSDYVNTLRGSNSEYEGYSRGATFPATAVPFGFNFWSPMTDASKNNWIYQYNQTAIQAFTISHMPSPWMGDRQTFQFMPQSGSVVVDRGSRAAAFSHANETAKAHAYSVKFNNGIQTEIAPTDHAASLRFTFPGTTSYLLFDSIGPEKGTVGASISFDNANGVISGYTDHSSWSSHAPRMYFYGKFSKAIAQSAKVSGQRELTSWVRFNTVAGEKVGLSMATSFISVAQAQSNLAQEIGAKSFDTVKLEAQNAWNTLLGKIEVEGASEDQKTILYSNLYRAFLYPNSAWENVNGTPSYASPYVSGNPVKTGKVYVNNGFWDTYRTTWPLYALLIPTKTGEMIDGFVSGYRDGGWITRWSAPAYANSMVGTSSDALIADAYLKGVRNFDISAAYDSMMRNAMTYSSGSDRGRKGMSRSIFMGYMPQDVTGSEFDSGEDRQSASWSLESYINDFAISQMAQALGRTHEAQYLLNRSLNYVHLFSPSVGFFRARKADGTWFVPDANFKPNTWGCGFTEGNAWHYSTLVPHDGQGLANLYSGKSALANKLDALFDGSRDYDLSCIGLIHEIREAYDVNMGQYAHSNQPGHHTLYMYSYAGTPWRIQQRVRAIIGLYKSGIANGDGYLGDEDNGEMSAWYLFSTMGFYPVSVGRPEYAIGAPFFTKMTVHLENGRDIVINAPNVSDTNKYIQSVTVNGQLYSRNFLPHSLFANGATLDFNMGPSPTTWGSGDINAPTSLTAGTAIAQPMADVAKGGTASASMDNPGSGEGAGSAFDDDSRTKWFAPQSNPWLRYQISGGKTVKMYTLTSANDFPDRDPKSWVLQASNDGTTWVTLDTQTGQTFAWRYQTRMFPLNNNTAYTQYRLQINEVNGSIHTQLAEFELLGKAL
ncbi:GH92 family glycosyl hydrolase [Stigmatella sp. ncwal1]|uniref:GH92 family glycosyl hydrolase n=1 Tax=Stigmatella ashevillensis TaxID=2995309 RepID=A0ABT5DHH3_9BACT|nr:GH92 family glycosyl hydrolase [Stigmatella ashevillena]MDC0712580.1 GH92 family glycosyl hydrolase [Stigmatella ashevillena]